MKFAKWVATAALVLGALAAPTAANASTPRADVPQAYVGALVENYSGAAIKADWTAYPYDPAACQKREPGESVTVDRASNLVLWTSGQDNACAVVKTPRFWYTGVFEAHMYVPAANGVIADWPAFWFAAAQPRYTEIDAFEGLRGVDNTTYWYGPDWRSLQSKSTGIPVNANRLPVYSPRPKPGWHTLDLVWAPDWAKVYVDGRLFTELRGTWFKPVPMQMILDMTEGYCNSGSSGPFCGGPRKAASLVVQYVRVWKFR